MHTIGDFLRPYHPEQGDKLTFEIGMPIIHKRAKDGKYVEEAKIPLINRYLQTFAKDNPKEIQKLSKRVINLQDKLSDYVFYLKLYRSNFQERSLLFHSLIDAVHLLSKIDKLTGKPSFAEITATFTQQIRDLQHLDKIKAQVETIKKSVSLWQRIKQYAISIFAMVALAAAGIFSSVLANVGLGLIVGGGLYYYFKIPKAEQSVKAFQAFNELIQVPVVGEEQVKMIEEMAKLDLDIGSISSSGLRFLNLASRDVNELLELVELSSYSQDEKFKSGTLKEYSKKALQALINEHNCLITVNDFLQLYCEEIKWIDDPTVPSKNDQFQKWIQGFHGNTAEERIEYFLENRPNEIARWKWNPEENIATRITPDHFTRIVAALSANLSCKEFNFRPEQGDLSPYLTRRVCSMLPSN